MAFRISEETIVLVVVIVGIFLLAMMCLAVSLNPREILDGSLFRCCGCCRHHRRNSPNGEDHHQTYDTLNEFIFEADHDTRRNINNGNQNRQAGFVALNNMPTTMEQVFPDLLGSDEPPSPHPSQRQGGDVESPLFGSGGANAELSEPLL
jgi:hypothetical protein